MSVFIDNIYKVKDEYLQQRSDPSCTKVNIEFSEDVFSSLYYFIGVLKLGDCVEDLETTLSLFDDWPFETSKPKRIDTCIMKQVDENKTGKTLTHLNISFSKTTLNDDQLISLFEFVDLCPNLEYLNLDLSNLTFVDLSEVEIPKKLQSLLKLRVLSLNINENDNFDEQSLKKWASYISKIENLIEFSLSIKNIKPQHWDGFFKAFYKNKKLNTLKINGGNKYSTMEEKRLQCSKNGYRKISRLVCIEIKVNNIINEMEQDFQEFLETFELFE